MKYKVIIILLILISYLSGCSASSGGGSSDSGSGLSSIDPENGLIEDTEQGIVAGLNLNENISDEESITVNGEIEWVEGLEGEALSLDSDGEFISLPDSDDLDLIGGGSVSLWVYPTENISFAGILHKGVETDFSDEAWSLQYWSEYKPSILIYNEAGARSQITASTALELNRWHHIAAAWGFDPADADGKSWFRFYINGIQQGELDVTTFLPLKNSAGDLIIGSQLPESHSDTYGHITFRGAIDNILIYDHLLSEAEISDLYNEYSGL